MHDETYQSVYFVYLIFVLFSGGAAFFFFRSLKSGYWGKDSEVPKYRMLEDDPVENPPATTGGELPRR